MYSITFWQSLHKRRAGLYQIFIIDFVEKDGECDILNYFEKLKWLCTFWSKVYFRHSPYYDNEILCSFALICPNLRYYIRWHVIRLASKNIWRMTPQHEPLSWIPVLSSMFISPKRTWKACISDMNCIKDRILLHYLHRSRKNSQ